MFEKLRKNTVLPACAFVVLISTTLSAQPRKIPKAIFIPEALRDGKLLSTHRKQVNDRIAWWKQQLLHAVTDEEIHRAGEKLLNDYQLYPNPSYQKEFAEETLKQYTDILNGKTFASKPDPLALLKRINAALAITQMDQPNLQPGLQTLVNDKNEALRYIGWLGYSSIRKNLFNTTETRIKPFLQAVTQAVSKETNPILLSQVYRVINLGTITGTIDEKLRLKADEAFLQALQASWAARCRLVQAVKPENDTLLPAMRLAVMALQSIGEDLQKNTKDPKAVTPCLQMVFDIASAAAQTYDRAWQNQQINNTLLEKCTNLLSACESALNALSGEKHTYLAEKTNPQVEVPARGAAVMEAVLVKWAQALKPKGVKDAPTPK